MADKLSFLPPVFPNRGTRGLDAFGAGGYNAPRTRGGKAYGHRGLDFLGDPGDPVIMSFPGFLLKPGRAYPDSDLGSIHIEGIGDWAGYSLTLLYVHQLGTIANGQGVLEGAPIGIVQNVAAYHEAKAGDGRKMLNHVHFQLRCGGELIDPTPLVRLA